MFSTIKKPQAKRKVFFSFNFSEDFWRTQQIRNIGFIERNTVVTANAWEEVKKKGEKAIENWINTNLEGKSCLVVLIGENTADRKWIDYEIKKAWSLGKGVVGIRINKLENQKGIQSKAGKNPFSGFTLCDKKINLDKIVQVKNPSGITGKDVYRTISENLTSWIEEAIKIRNEFKCT